MMVEIFCGILSGANYAHHVRKWKESHRQANLVHKTYPLFGLLDF
jgi:LDH2 family malate/lactate/ureidoglycolate dehydrogenase